MTSSEPNDPADLPPHYPYAPPKAELARAGGTMRQSLLALLKLAAVGASGFIAFCATCVATLSLTSGGGGGAKFKLPPLTLLSPVVGLAVLIGMSYYLFVRRPRSGRKT